ncbi:hypothetical protein [Hoeflea sp.]|uniref:hypothetical protein n=1 Tax=Hoeflea sp. TaxID=1940281 RepID=UPI0019B8A46C|nr:hypothetical protein [Hoeflea sp.]MBC7280048.1 hypothetical protein [Hoeflea sp.]
MPDTIDTTYPLLNAEVSGPYLNIREQASETAPPHRRVLAPGLIVGGIWKPTDLAAEAQAVRDAAVSAWTPSVVAAYRAQAEQHHAAELAMFPPPSTDPADWPLNRFQFEGMLLTMGVSFADIETAIAAMDSTATEKAFAISRLRNAQTYQRNHPLIAALMPVFGLTDAAVDAAWMEAKDIH